jgi:hypothetical protein
MRGNAPDRRLPRAAHRQTPAHELETGWGLNRIGPTTLASRHPDGGENPPMIIS